MPVTKATGSEMMGASFNTTGTMCVRATKVGADTALAQIVALVQEAQNLVAAHALLLKRLRLPPETPEATTRTSRPLTPAGNG